MRWPEARGGAVVAWLWAWECVRGDEEVRRGRVVPLDGSEESLTLLCMASQHRQGDVSIEMRCVCAIALFYKRLASQRQSGQEGTVA